ncbi:cupin domain-containing protein [Planctomycetota bacterium]
MVNAIVLKADQAEVINADWGQLTWWASANLGNSDDMTIGRCILKPACENPKHFHPNCSEVLVVAHGRIMHTAPNGGEIELSEGDSISIGADFPHQARNIGDTDAVLFIAFSSADRRTVGE